MVALCSLNSRPATLHEVICSTAEVLLVVPDMCSQQQLQNAEVATSRRPRVLVVVSALVDCLLLALYSILHLTP